MKTVLVLSILCAAAYAAPNHLVRSPLVASPLLASPWLARSPLIGSPLVASPLIGSHLVAPVATPLLAKVDGESPASTVHAKHVQQVVVPQVVSYSLPAPAPAHIISAYSIPAPVVSSH